MDLRAILTTHTLFHPSRHNFGIYRLSSPTPDAPRLTILRISIPTSSSPEPERRTFPPPPPPPRLPSSCPLLLLLLLLLLHFLSPLPCSSASSVKTPPVSHIVALLTKQLKVERDAHAQTQRALHDTLVSLRALSASHPHPHPHLDLDLRSPPQPNPHPDLHQHVFGVNSPRPAGTSKPPGPATEMTPKKKTRRSQLLSPPPDQGRPRPTLVHP